MLGALVAVGCTLVLLVVVVWRTRPSEPPAVRSVGELDPSFDALQLRVDEILNSPALTRELLLVTEAVAETKTAVDGVANTLMAEGTTAKQEAALARQEALTAISRYKRPTWIAITGLGLAVLLGAGSIAQGIHYGAMAHPKMSCSAQSCTTMGDPPKPWLVFELPSVNWVRDNYDLSVTIASGLLVLVLGVLAFWTLRSPKHARTRAVVGRVGLEPTTEGL